MKHGTVFVVAIAIIFFGIYDFLKYKRCVNALEEAVKLFNLFKSEIHYKGSDYYALCNAGEKENFKYLLFNNSVISLSGIDDERVKTEFSYFVEKIGTTDVEGQLSVCTQAIERLSSILKEYSKKEASKLQVNMSLSILGALSMIIIFI